jgi:hypothetical protein
MNEFLDIPAAIDAWNNMLPVAKWMRRFVFTII